MANKRNNQGRSVGDGRYVSLHEWMLRSAAWRSLNVYSRCLYIEIKRRYNGKNNGDIIMSRREAEELVGCSNVPVMAAFKDLQEKGFIRPQQKGSFSWKARADGKANRATTWVLTEYPQDVPERHLTPTKEFMSWCEEKSRDDEITPMGRRRHPIEEPMGRRDHPIGMTRSPHKAGFDGVDGVTTSSTIKLPYTEQERGEMVIDEVVNMIAGTDLDTETYIDKIKRLPPNEQFVAAKRDLAIARRRTATNAYAAAKGG